MRKAVVLIFLLSLLQRSLSVACECPALEPLSRKSCELYDVIFRGTVDSIVPCGTQGIGTAYFTVTGLYRGTTPQHVAVDYDCTSACLMSFSKNEEWLIYGIYQRFDLLTVNICSYSRKRITDGTADFYEASTQRSFDKEDEILKSLFGMQSFAAPNKLNEQQKYQKPHNDQPSAIDKLWLLLISLGVMIIVYIVSKKYFRNDK